MCIPKNIRLEVLKRDGYTCVYCGRKLNKKHHEFFATVDHIVPVSKGGTDDIENLATACNECNNALGDMFTTIEEKKAWIRQCRYFSAKDFMDEIRTWEKHIRFHERRRIASCF